MPITNRNVWHTLNNEINFLNIKKAEMDITFYDETFTAQSGSLFVLEEKGEKHKMHAYTYPSLKRVLDEKCRCLALCSSGDNYYIYV